MSIALRPSKVTLPAVNRNWNNLYEFLVEKFPLVDCEVWHARFAQGKIHWLSGERAQLDTAFQPNMTLCYYREVEQEPVVPFAHDILFQNEHLLVACKPHFLPVTPGGRYVNECLLERIRQQRNLPDLVPLHRLDRETAGLVLFSINPQTRGIYAQLFADKKIKKTYQAIAKLKPEIKLDNLPLHWSVNNRLVKSQASFLMQEVEGEINSQSEIKLLSIKDNFGLFELQPITGKTHQLRLHMSKIGMPILNDSFYPTLHPQAPLSFEQSLQLLAKSICFIDPVSQKPFSFESARYLDL